jgi:hypothetical protein
VPFHGVAGSSSSVSAAIVVFAVVVMGTTLSSFIWRANYLRHHPVGRQPAWIRWVIVGLVLAVCGTEFGILLATDDRPVTVGRVISMIAITAAVVAYVLWRFTPPRHSRVDKR